jgi:hypothetical protein
MTIIYQPYDGPDSFLTLYRHCDGYPAEAGAAIVEVLKGNPPDCETILAGLLSMRYNHEGRPSEPIYRPVTYGPDQQGDLEHVYAIRRQHTEDGAQFWTITHSHRIGWTEGQDEWTSWPKQTYTLAGFVEVVNQERRQMNYRLKGLRASSKHYAEATDYPMLTL